MIKIGIVFDAIFGINDLIKDKMKKCDIYEESTFEILLYESWNDFLSALKNDVHFDLLYLDVLYNQNLLCTKTSEIVYSFLPNVLLIYLYSTDDFNSELKITNKRAALELPLDPKTFNNVFEEICSHLSRN